LFRNYVAVVLIWISLAGASMAGSSPFSFKAGVGYDYLSQRYFLDSMNISGADSVLTQFALTSEYLNDFKGMLELAYRYRSRNQFDLSANLEQTKDITRLKLTSSWQAFSKVVDLRWRNQVDWRNQSADSGASLGSYVSGSSNLKLRKAIGSGNSVWGQMQAEGTDFIGDAEQGYDYYRLSGKLGLEHHFGLFSTASINGFLVDRNVSDSVTLNYQGFGVEGSFSGSLSRFELDLLTRWESKDYNREPGSDDYTRLDIESRSKVDLGHRLLTRQVIELEITSYDPEDPLNDDYTRLGLTLTGGFELGGLEVGIGPDFEMLHESWEDSAYAEDYLESAGLLDVTIISPGGLFASTQSRVGSRKLDFTNEYQSDFTFYELSILGDWPICRGLNINLLMSCEWEWHDQESENNRVLLLSSGLYYRF
jgi:hypothetical protein